MANSSNPPDGSARMQDNEYLYASNANVSNFVSVKLSGGRNYHLWKKQMQCLMKTHDFYNLVEDDGPARDPETMNKIIKYDSLLQGWILGSLCEEVLGIVVNCNSAKEVWLELKRYFDSTEQETKDKNAVLENTTANDKGGNPAESEAKGKEATQIETKGTKTDDKVSLKKPLTDAISVDIPTEYKDTNSTESKAKCEDATETEIKDSDSTKEEKEVERKDENAEMKDWEDVLYELFYSGNKVIKTEQINNDANNALHIAVGLHRNDMIMEVLPRIVGELTGIRDSKGRTLLHVAAVVDNTDAAELLIKRDSKLLDSIDIEKKTPLDVAYDHMHLDTITCLLESAEAERKRKKAAGNVEIKRKGSAADVSADSPQLYVETGVKVLVNAISAKQYSE
ncbi:putative ankyrin repeat-containing domain-containing protein [Helianthus annuus]|nr:putative ankyrin repeat-containing domain-containing protein [Helianthus annuus]